MPVYVTSDTYVDFGTKRNDKESKFEVGDQVRISKYKSIFVTFYAAKQSEKSFVIKKVENTVVWTYVIKEHGEETLIVKDKSNRDQN